MELPVKRSAKIRLPEQADSIRLVEFIPVLEQELYDNTEKHVFALMVGERVIDMKFDAERPLRYFLLEKRPWFVHTQEPIKPSPPSFDSRMPLPSRFSRRTSDRLEPGINLEGKCSLCGQTVILNKGFTDFDLVNDRYECECQACKSTIEPTACIFSDCVWKYTCRKSVQFGRRPQIIAGPWNTTRNGKTERFSLCEPGTLDLKLICKEALDKICAMCTEEINVYEKKKSKCGHYFHSGACYNQANDDFDCIECKAIEKMTDYQKLFG